MLFLTEGLVLALSAFVKRNNSQTHGNFTGYYEIVKFLTTF